MKSKLVTISVAVSVIFLSTTADPLMAQQSGSSDRNSKLPTVSPQKPITDEDSATAKMLEAARKAASRQEFLLRYRFAQGEIIKWTVEQVATTKTSVAETSEVVSLRTTSTAAWKVKSVDSYGCATLEKSIVKLSGWRKATDKDPVSYDSSTDEQPPLDFEQIASMIGKPLLTLKVDPQGKVLDKKSYMHESDFGVGDTFLVLPDEALKIGHKWYLSDEHTCFHTDKRVKQVKVRKAYTLKEVNDNLAVIEYRTEILTPIEDPTIQSQISQHITHGKIVLDLDLGRIHSKSANWNQKVQGFLGPKSLSHYLGQYTATLARPSGSKSQTAADVTPAKDLKLKTHDGEPIFRR